MSVSESRRSTFPGRVTFQPHRRLHAMCARGTSIVVMVQQNVSRAIHIPRQCIPGGGTRQGPGGGGGHRKPSARKGHHLSGHFYRMTLGLERLKAEFSRIIVRFLPLNSY